MLKVFLSSTYIDLRPERQAVRDAILRLQCQFSGMEYFGSDPERPKEVSLRLLESCNVYVGIVAHRYGSVDSETGKSITHLEYERARARKIPTLLYEKDQNSPVEPTSQFIDFDSTYRNKLFEFREVVRRECLIQSFANPDELAAKLTADLARLAIADASKETADGRSWHDPGSPYYQSLIGDVRNIPMVGPVAVGKTVYGCMLLHQPIARVAAHGLSVELNEESSILFKYYEHLSRGEWAPATGLFDHNFVDVCLRRKKLFGHQEYCVRILDTSGEYWHHSSDPEYHYGNHRTGWDSVFNDFAGCFGLALFFEAKTERLAGRGVDYDPMYANTLGMLGRNQPSGKFARPVAVILTKCDLVPGLLGDVHHATRYLRDEYPLAYSQLRARLSSFSVFPTSSVGEVDRDGKPKHLQPVGLWDPILWLVENQ